MKFIKKHQLLIYIIISYFTIIPFMLSIFNLLNIKTNKTIIFIISILYFALIGFIAGKKANKKGYMKGLIIGIILSIILIIMSVILNTFKIQSLIYYLVLIITSTLFGSLGIGKK